MGATSADSHDREAGKSRKVVLTVQAERKTRKYLVRVSGRHGVVALRAAWRLDKAGHRVEALKLKPGYTAMFLVVSILLSVVELYRLLCAAERSEPA